jgi:biopolymer transport protein ExbB/TolQ
MPEAPGRADNLSHEAETGYTRPKLLSAAYYVTGFRRRIDDAEEDLHTLSSLVDKLPNQATDKGYISEANSRLDAFIKRYNRAFDAALKAEEIHDDTPNKDALSERLQKDMDEGMLDN